MLIGADLAWAGIAVVLAVFHQDLAVVYAAAFGLSGFSVFFNPAASSLPPSLIGPHAAAIGQIWCPQRAVLVAILAHARRSFDGQSWRPG